MYKLVKHQQSTMRLRNAKQRRAKIISSPRPSRSRSHSILNAVPPPRNHSSHPACLPVRLVTSLIHRHLRFSLRAVAPLGKPPPLCVRGSPLRNASRKPTRRRERSGVHARLHCRSVAIRCARNRPRLLNGKFSSAVACAGPPCLFGDDIHVSRRRCLCECGQWSFVSLHCPLPLCIAHTSKEPMSLLT